MRVAYQYQADIPELARPRGEPLRWRSSRKVALMDMERALHRYMIAEGCSGVGWARWAFKLAGGLTSEEAPDGTVWMIVRRLKPDG